ncbi:MAG: DNA cytosine methyltransferase [bacterium]|nr:DNA cytosine methyltransferase [bacterium]
MVGLGEEDFSSLSPELIQKYTEQFKTPERFIQFNGNIVVLPIPAEKQDLAFLPDRFETGEHIQTPRDSFQVTAMSLEQMEAAGYGLHHISDGGEHLIIWKLLYSFARIIRETMPHIVSMENVPELSDENVFHDFVNALIELGYNVDWHVVYCPEYGVPQNRKRLVLLASRLGQIALITPLYNQDNYPTVRDAIGNLPPIDAGEQNEIDPLHRACRLSEINLRRIRSSVPGGTWRDWDESLQLPCHKRKSGRTYPSVYGRMCWDEPSPTITTQFYGYGNGRFGHPEQDRALSLREGAILQSFPPDYIFTDEDHPSNRRDLGIHIGNAVPVELGRAIGISILNHLQEVGTNG